MGRRVSSATKYMMAWPGPPQTRTHLAALQSKALLRPQRYMNIIVRSGYTLPLQSNATPIITSPRRWERKTACHPWEFLHKVARTGSRILVGLLNTSTLLLKQMRRHAMRDCLLQPPVWAASNYPRLLPSMCRMLMVRELSWTTCLLIRLQGPQPMDVTCRLLWNGYLKEFPQ